jgi:predicted nucleic acid-binding Zn ribbon protein
MICPDCQCLREPKDFLFNDKCFKCVYKDKTEIKKPKKYCRICAALVGTQRKVFCSQECMEEGHKAQKKTYWATSIPAAGLNWKRSAFVEY